MLLGCCLYCLVRLCCCGLGGLGFFLDGFCVISVRLL